MAVAVTAAGFAVFTLLYAPQPLLPHLAESFGLRPGGASLAVSVSTAAVAVGVLPLAALSELVGRRPVMYCSVFGAVLVAAACAFAPNYPVLLVLRAVLGIAVAGLPATAMAYLAERLDGTGRGIALGALVSGNSMGGMSGRLLAGVSYDWVGWRGALGATAGLAVLAAVVFVIALPGRDPVATGRSGGIFTGLRTALARPVLLAQYAVAALAMGSFVALYNSAGFRLTSEPLALAPAVASLVFVSYAAGTFTSPVAGRLAERHGRAPVVLAGLAVTLAGIALTLPDVVWPIAIGFVVLTAGFFGAHSAASGWVGAAAPADARGQASGFYQCAYYAGGSVGGTAGTAVYGQFGWAALVAVVAVWLLIAAAGIVLVALNYGWRARPVFAGAPHPVESR
ncbi:MAG: MFS transporter [Pseudonocardiaceae bacterium]|nr:MFS transporter [Pseudonocardiaceae bacterium]